MVDRGDEDQSRLVLSQPTALHLVEYYLIHRGQIRSDPVHLNLVDQLHADLQNLPSARAASRERAPPAIYCITTHKMRTHRYV